MMVEKEGGGKRLNAIQRCGEEVGVQNEYEMFPTSC